jgi:dipeptidyl aminopeptidase/acylaminoacyl peptidase
MKPITSESLLDLVFLDDVRVSPDGRCAVFVRQSIDAQANPPNGSYKRTIWIKDLTSDAPAQPFTGGTKDSAPRFSPDGARLGFVSGRSDKPQVFVLNLHGGEARSVAAHENGIGSFEWSPDGNRIAFTASLRADERQAEDKKHNKTDKGDGEDTEDKADQADQADKADKGSVFQQALDKKREKEARDTAERLKFDPRTIRRFPYRTGTSFLGEAWTHLYVADVPASLGDDVDTPEAKPLRVTDGEDSYGTPSWVADGSALISTYTRELQGPRWYMYHDVVRIPIHKNGPGESDAPARTLERLTQPGHSCSAPRVSPNGQWIAYVRFQEDRPGHRNSVLSVMPATGGEPRPLTATLDRSVESYKWSDDSQHLYFTLQIDGNVNLWRVALTSGKIEQLTSLSHDVQAFDVDRDGRVAFIASTPQDPSALYVREVDGVVRTLYKPNRKFLEAHDVAEVEEIQYLSDGLNIQGWVIKPPNFEEGKKYPLALEIHGGPHVMWTPSFRSGWHEWQTLAHSGYVVFFCNPRGADGYGEEFTSGCWKDWGPGPMRDVLRGVDEVVQRGYIDPNRMVLTGGSYGGYLTAWIIGHDQRFKAACAQRGVYNLISMRGTTDIPLFNDFESGYTPWEDVQGLWAQSPIAYAPNINTPLLIEHSEQDYRVPIEQGEQLFTALNLLGKTVEMIRWPREGHELSRSGEPRHRVERIQRMVDWFDKHIS